MSRLRLRIFDGTRQLFSVPAQFLIRIVDGNQKEQIWRHYSTNDLTFDLPFFDNFGDNYSVAVFCDGYKQAGFVPVKLSDAYLTTLDIMLISNTHSFDFASARWPTAKSVFPFLTSGADDSAGEQRYISLIETSPKSLACLFNLCEAMRQINLSQGTPLSYLRELRWDGQFAPAQDRIFGWCEVELLDQVKRAAATNTFTSAIAPGLLHPGATASWKQVQFGEANLQLTFHENDTIKIDRLDCIMVEIDMDYFKDLAAHILVEVIHNALTQTLTDPAEVYVLRWIASRTAGIPEFQPLFTIVSGSPM